MDKNLLKYRISPRVVQANQMQKIEVEGLDDSSRFYDDVDYKVQIVSVDGWSFKENSELRDSDRDCRSELVCRPVDGVLSIEFFFTGETRWKILITRDEAKNHTPERYIKYSPWLLGRLSETFSFEIYSLEADLYEKRPFRGDLHIHTYESDGSESPEMVAAQYRKFGYDFIAITDHYTLAPSLRAIGNFAQLDTTFRIFPGEEIHPVRGYIFHMVNFNPSSSVNAIAQNDVEAVKAEVEEIAKGLSVENAENRKELAWFIWICDAIRKSGGIAIYPHPYWVLADAMNVHSWVSEEILKRKICDVFEVIGGTEKKYNRMQVQLYYDMLSKGVRLPIVASSDSHCSLDHGIAHFDQAWTMVFSEDTDRIPENILAGNSVAVDNFEVDDKNVYGDLRLVKYAWFLLENYYETHDALCNASGQAILRYVQGDETQKTLIAMLEQELQKFNTVFWGK